MRTAGSAREGSVLGTGGPSSSPPPRAWPLRDGTLVLEEGQATPKALLQELHVGGRGRVFEGGREAEDVVLNILGLHGGDIQEVVGVDVVDHSAVGQTNHHLHGEAVLLQVQAG